MERADRNSETDQWEPPTVGELVAAAIKRWRDRHGWSQAELAERMQQVGVRWVHTSVSKIESGDRQVTVDELVAVAFVLGVSPTVLYTPHDTRPMKVVPHITTDGGLVYRWACGDNWPTADVEALRFYDNAAPHYEYSAERLLPGLQALRRSVSIAIAAAGAHPGLEAALSQGNMPGTTELDRVRNAVLQLDRLAEAADELYQASRRILAAMEQNPPPRRKVTRRRG